MAVDSYLTYLGGPNKPGEVIAVYRLSSILLKMRTRKADFDFAACWRKYRDLSTLHDRQLVLTDLVAFRKVRVEVVLARENGGRVFFSCIPSVRRQPDADPLLA